jgi:hypothetical protein
MAAGDFLVGANLPWMTYGGDFGSNAWHPEGGLKTRIGDLAGELDRVAMAGIRRIRWFMLCDGRAGIRFAADGLPLGLDEAFFSDVDAAVGAAGDRGIDIMFVLLDFLWCARARLVHGVQLGGRRGVLEDASTRAALLGDVLLPIFERYGGNPHVFAWDVMNEPEWATCGLGARRWRACVSAEAMRSFVRDTAALVHRHTRQPVTVGSASARWIDAWRDLGLDFYQVHWYAHLESRAPLARPVRLLGLDRPVVLGECPSRVAPAELRRILETARAAGYEGAYVWSVLADDRESDFGVAEGALKTLKA